MCEIKDITDKEGYKILRKRKKITLKQIAEFIGLSDSTICRWENNLREMTKEQVASYNYFIENYSK